MGIYYKNILERILNRYQLYRYIYPFVKKNIKEGLNHDDVICIFSQPRSGSTWLSEILLTNKNSYLIDEPLRRGAYRIDKIPHSRIRKISGFSELGFYYIQPILENDNWPEAEKIFSRMLNGQIPELSLYNEITLKKLKRSNFFIVKIIYGSLLMHWFHANFPNKILYLIRHPLAVIASQLNHHEFNKVYSKKNNQTRLTQFRNCNIFIKYKYILDNIRSTEELLAFFWSIQVKHSLYHPNNNRRWLTISYEKLILDFHNEVNRIFSFIGKDIPEDILKMHYRPSKSTKYSLDQHVSNNNIINRRQIDSWKRKLTKEQIKRILNVTEMMGVDLYSEKLEPNYDILYKSHPKP